MAGEVWPGIFRGGTSFSCLDARKGSEKKIKASAEAGEVWPGTKRGPLGAPAIDQCEPITCGRWLKR